MFVGPTLAMCVVCCLALAASSAADEPETVRIYLDADMSVARTSAVSIERGMRTALSEVDFKLGGRHVEIVPKNHRGSSPRSKRHLEQYLQDDRALAIYSGLHSPPLLAHRDFINESGILVLDPWAAAGPITRYPSSDNWIFRLSVDDTKAGHVIVRHAVEEKGFRHPYLLLEDTGWGKSNERTMTAALKDRKVAPAGIHWFNWNLSRLRARALLREIAASDADGILLVANAAEAKTLFEEMIGLGLSLPVCSHWGITGGDFPSVVNAGMREKIELTFIQTRFSFVSHPQDSLGIAVLDRVRALFPNEIRTAADITAPTGFIHAYDLTKILIAAVDRIDLTGDMEADRAARRSSLEQIEKPVRGLVKVYEKPFSPFVESHPDAHEALTRDDLVMARYGSQDEIVLINAPLVR
jgi:branched-chain amino acid transport system substrate-binding protein